MQFIIYCLIVLSLHDNALNVNMTELTPSQQLLSACTGAVITSLFMTPFDVVKVRLQAQQRMQLNRSCFLYCNGLMEHLCNCAKSICSNPERGPWYNRPVPLHLNGTIDAFVKISQQEGVKSLWSGLPPTLVVAIPNTVIYFSTYEYLRSRFFNLYEFQTGGSTPPSLVGGIAGGLARMWSVTVVSPFELVRTKMQARTTSYKAIGEVLCLQISVEGLHSLWKGWVPTVLRDVPFSVFYWWGYEGMKKLMHQERPNYQFTLVAGALSGGLAGMLTLPLDVVKTHRQIEIGEQEIFTESPKSGSTWRLLMQIYKQQGIPGLFTGVVPRLAKVMPACAIMITTYEYAKSYFRKTNLPLMD